MHPDLFLERSAWSAADFAARALHNRRMFLALDQGTTSSRAIVFAADGSVQGMGQCEFAQHFPAPGFVEHDAEEILATQLHAAELALASIGRPTVTAVSITNQRETVVLWERATGRPLHRAIVWQDRRTAAMLEPLRAAGIEQWVRDCTGLPLDPYFSASKIAWLLDHVPGARLRAERGELCAGTIDSWLLFRFTAGQVFATDPSNASRTSLYDLRTGTWSEALCAQFRVPRNCLAEIRSSAADYGNGPGGWPLRAVLGDQQAALFGHGCTTRGAMKCTYGTGAFVLRNAGGSLPERPNTLLTTVAWRIGAETTFAHEGSVLVCGAAIQWLRDQLGVLASARDAEAMARSVPDTGGVVFVPAFAGLGTPRWDAAARGLLIGLTRGTSKAHIVRAAIEAMALQVDDVVQAMGDGASNAPLHVDGGATTNGLLLELQATLLGVPVVRPGLLEATAFGAFRMSMLGAGACHSAAELPALPGAAVTVLPTGGIDVRRLRSRWREAVARASAWAE